MTTDLWMLAASVGLAWLLIMVAATPGILKNGLRYSLGNRDEKRESSGGHARAERLAANMMENLPLFAALVLVAHVSETSDGQSALGAQIFFYARIAHALSYLVGIPVLRTLTWFVSVIGMGLIGASLFG